MVLQATAPPKTDQRYKTEPHKSIRESKRYLNAFKILTAETRY